MSEKSTHSMSLYTSPEAEKHLQQAFKDALGIFCPENVQEFQQLVTTPAKQIENATLRTTTSDWPETAVSWLLEEVFGWQSPPYLFIRKDDDGETVFGREIGENYLESYAERF